MARTFTVWDDVQLLGPWPEGWEPSISEVQDAALGVTIVYAVVPTVDGLGRTVKREVPMLKHRQQRVTAAIDTREAVRSEAKAAYAEQRLAWITTQRLEGEGSLAERAEHGLRYGTSHK